MSAEKNLNDQNSNNSKKRKVEESKVQQNKKLRMEGASTHEENKGTIENRVMVRVWRTYGLLGSVGHVSIETPNRYISLWPKHNSRKGNKLKQTFEERDSHFRNGYDSDKNEEDGRVPEFVVCLYGLNIVAMEAKFDLLRQETESWTLLGRNRLINRKNSNSCSGLAHDLLIAGGIAEFMFRPEWAVHQHMRTTSFEFFKGTIEEDNPEEKRETKSYVDAYCAHELEIKMQQAEYDAKYGEKCNGKGRLSAYGEIDCSCNYCAAPSRPINDWITPRNGGYLLYSIIISPGDIERIASYAKKNDLLGYPETNEFDNHYMSSDYLRRFPSIENNNECIIS